MTLEINLKGEKFFSKTEMLVKNWNDELLAQMKSNKISPFKYNDEKLNVDNQRTICLIMNYLASPVTSPLLLLKYIIVGFICLLKLKTNKI